MTVPKKPHKESRDEGQFRPSRSDYGGTNPYQRGQSVHHPYHQDNPGNPYARKPSDERIAPMNRAPSDGGDSE